MWRNHPRSDDTVETELRRKSGRRPLVILNNPGWVPGPCGTIIPHEELPPPSSLKFFGCCRFGVLRVHASARYARRGVKAALAWVREMLGGSLAVAVALASKDSSRAFSRFLSFRKDSVAVVSGGHFFLRHFPLARFGCVENSTGFRTEPTGGRVHNLRRQALRCFFEGGVRVFPTLTLTISQGCSFLQYFV
jgi:hypothetical protein